MEPAPTTEVEPHLPPGVVRGPETRRAFHLVLANTLIANVTTSYLWFALTFWAYLQTRSVMATAIIGGSFMLLASISAMAFGTLVDRHKKRNAMVASSAITLGAYALSGALYLLFDESVLIDWGRPIFWAFAGVILVGGVVESLRNIALSTTVTLLVPSAERDKANGLVGAVQGISFMVTSVFSGLSIGLLGMGWTVAIAIALTAVALLHLLTLSIPEVTPEPDTHGEKRPLFDVANAWAAIITVPGLLALIFFTTFNNLVGGVFMALMDPYGLELFSVETWGIVLGVTSTGFLLGGALIGKIGLGKQPLRTLMLANLAVAVLGATFTLRELWWLYAAGIWLFMAVMPFAEAAEQTILQRVVPFKKQGRVFGFAQSVEMAAAPISAFLIGPIAQFSVIPYMRSEAGREHWGWLLGDGQARGIALLFLIASLIMAITVLIAVVSPPYRRLTTVIEVAPEPITDGEATTSEPPG